MNSSETAHLILKEIALEFRKKAAIFGLLLYLVSSVFLSYVTFKLRQDLLNPAVWSSLFWITALFTCVNVIAKSFMGESKGRQHYYYSIANPYAILFSKIIYNFILCLLITFAAFLLFALLLGNPVNDLPLFIVILILVSMGFATSLTVLSGIAARTSSSHVLMAVLSFPVVISILVTGIKVTKNCLDGLDQSVSYDGLIILLAINFLVTAVSYLLFPFVWRS